MNLDRSALPSNARQVFSRGIFLVKALTEKAELDAEFDQSCCEVSLGPRRAALIASHGDLQIISRGGAWRVQKIPLGEAAKLLAFLESGSLSEGAGRTFRRRSSDGVVIDVPGDLSLWKFERWLIAGVFGGGDDVRSLLDFLRAQEMYGLVCFLLGESAHHQSVADLAVRYGVSASHFRRLCRQALGCGLKRELRRWRAATAVLEVVEGGESMTDIAMSNGFSSSSHFSTEIKALFGISLGQFRRRA